MIWHVSWLLEPKEAFWLEERLPNSSLFDGTDSNLMQVEAYLSSEEYAALAPLFVGKLEPKKERLEMQDWVALSQENCPPVSAGAFYIHGMGHGPSSTHKFSLYIEPTCAFGSGHHETTQGCLLLIQDLYEQRPWVNALDLGCGSGILALAMEHLHPGHVQGSDCDPEAVALAMKAARDHGVSIPFFVAEGLPAEHSYDVIVANLFSYVLRELAPFMQGARDLILSGILLEQEQEVMQAYSSWTLKKRLPMGLWVSLHFEA